MKNVSILIISMILLCSCGKKDETDPVAPDNDVSHTEFDSIVDLDEYEPQDVLEEIQTEVEMPDEDMVEPEACLKPETENCNISGDQKCEENNVLTCEVDENNCRVLIETASCEDGDLCYVDGQCAPTDPIILMTHERETDDTITISVHLNQPEEKLLPRIIEFTFTIDTHLTYIEDSAKAGDVVTDAEKNLSMSALTKTRLRAAIVAMNDNIIHSGKLLSFSVKQTEKKSAIIDIQRDTQVFTPPSADMAVTFGPHLCIAECSERTCGSDGCGGSCGTCDTGMSCTEDGKCNEL